MAVLRATVTYEDDAGGTHIKRFTLDVPYVSQGLCTLEEMIEGTEERQHWTAVKVDIHQETYEKVATTQDRDVAFAA